MTSLQALTAALRSCTACPLHAAATQAVPGRGPERARVMLVGEQPGDREDLEGRTFVGPAGQLLQRVLAGQPWAADAYLTNAVKHFKYEFRGKRRLHKTAAQKEVLACGPWLEREIALVQPAILVALGATAAFSLMGQTVPVLANEGRWLARHDGRPVLIVRHPSALLRTPDAERDAAIVQWTAALARVAEGPPSSAMD
ncbi:MAG: UdgX family uracil-DNA binding protein [Rubrivivax sp.]|nr:UdgX family uracil-DNA binding protein [Rubrivivax sp.]